MRDAASAIPGEITTDIPARMDRLPWSRFHLLVVVALGIYLAGVLASAFAWNF